MLGPQIYKRVINAAVWSETQVEERTKVPPALLTFLLSAPREFHGIPWFKNQESDPTPSVINKETKLQKDDGTCPWSSGSLHRRAV